MLDKKIGFLGTGQMGGALITAFYNFFEKNLKSLKLSKQDVKDRFYLFDTSPDKKNVYENFGFKNFCNLESEVFLKADIIFLCVKPDLIQPLLERNIDLISHKNSENKKLLISIAAGISIEFMEKVFESAKANQPKIIRIMSNHLCSINESSSVYCINNLCDSDDQEIINLLLKNVGLIKKINESQINAYTALAGSGPAFVYLFVESIIDGCIRNGIDFNSARDYSVQTVFAAAKYLLDKNERNPSNLKYVVTTPNGTTIAGLEALEKNNFKYGVIQAITQATKRGKEIEEQKMKIFAKSKF